MCSSLDINMGVYPRQYHVLKSRILAYYINMNQDNVRKVLAQNIKQRRKELGITQTKLAELADISESYMNDIERCQTWISDKTLSKLAWALNLELHELFISNNEPTIKSTDRKDTYLLFQKHKQEINDYIEKSFDTLIRKVMEK